MESRENELFDLQNYIEKINKDLTMVLHSLQWDRNHLLESKPMVCCKYDKNHMIPVDKQKMHEYKCCLKSKGYCRDDALLPDPFDKDAKTLVTFDTDQIQEIIENASKNDPLFRKGSGPEDSQPLSVERLQCTFTADERRAIHDAVVNEAPKLELVDLELPSNMQGKNENRPKSQVEIMAELRDMRRRRAKYRVAAKSKNYSHALRELISTQMELYTQIPQTEKQGACKNGSHSKNGANVTSNSEEFERNNRNTDYTDRRKDKETHHKQNDRYRNVEKYNDRYPKGNEYDKNDQDKSRSNDPSHNKDERRYRDGRRHNEYETDRDRDKHRHYEDRYEKSKTTQEAGESSYNKSKLKEYGDSDRYQYRRSNKDESYQRNTHAKEERYKESRHKRRTDEDSFSTSKDCWNVSNINAYYGSSKKRKRDNSRDRHRSKDSKYDDDRHRDRPKRSKETVKVKVERDTCEREERSYTSYYQLKETSVKKEYD